MHHKSKVLRLVGWGSVAAALTLLVSFAFVGQTGCYTQECVGDSKIYGDATHGELVSPDVWESNPQESGWLEFTHRRTYFFAVHGFEGRTIEQVLPYISTDPNPNANSQYTLAAGNLAEIQDYHAPLPTDTPTIRVFNDTCADYWLRVVVVAVPKATGVDAGITDSGVDAGVTDSSADAIADTGAKE